MKTNKLRNLVRMGVPMLALALSGAFIASCGETGDEPTPVPPVEKPVVYPHAVSSFDDVSRDMGLMTSEAGVTRDTVFITVAQKLGYKTENLDVLKQLVTLCQKANVKVAWGNHGIYPAETDIEIKGDLLDILASSGFPITFNETTGAMFTAAAENKKKLSVEQQKFTKQVGAADFVINTADDLEKCNAAKSGDVITLAGKIKVDMQKIAPLAAAIKAGATLAPVTVGALEALVSRDVNLEDVGFNAIAAAWSGNPITVSVATNPKTGVPYVTVFYQSTFDAARTKATSGKTAYTANFVGTDGQLINPIISGNRDPRYDVTDSTTFARINRLDVGTFGGANASWEIAYHSFKDAGLTFDELEGNIPNIAPGTVDFYYPLPDKAGEYSAVVNWYDERKISTKTHIDAGEWVAKGDKSPYAYSVLGMKGTKIYNKPGNKIRVVLKNVDQLVACVDSENTHLFNGRNENAVGPSLVATNIMESFKQYAYFEKYPTQITLEKSNGESATEILCIEGGYPTPKWPMPFYWALVKPLPLISR